MFALHSLHHYVAILHSGRLNCPLTLLGDFCVRVCPISSLRMSHLCSLIKPLSALLYPVVTQWQPIVLDAAFKMETICVLYRPGQCGTVSLTKQAAVFSEYDDPIV